MPHQLNINKSDDKAKKKRRYRRIQKVATYYFDLIKARWKKIYRSTIY